MPYMVASGGLRPRGGAWAKMVVGYSVTLRFLVGVGSAPPTGVDLASSARRDGGWSAFGAWWLPGTGVDLGLSAGAATPRRLLRNAE